MAFPPRACVLVVDDNDANRLLVVETLVPEGAEVIEAASGEAALAAFALRPADVVLMDVRMPDLDGFQTLERLRALPSGEDVPVIFLTALRDLETFDRARAAGAVDFLTKPVRPTELISRVETSILLRRLGVEARDRLVEIRRQRDDLLRVQLQKERLAAFVVHDLKTPLATMHLHATLLARIPRLPEEARESTAAIREQCDRLHQLVMNLLDVSRADEGQLVAHTADVELTQLLREIADELGVQAQARAIALIVEVHADLAARADADLLRRVLANLVDNSLRHTPEGGEVHLRACSTADGGTELRVEDTGPGIPEALRDRIFDPFVQLDSSSSRSGRGLGLAFCRAAIAAHGGTIRVDGSRAGASFVLTLPGARP
ncbi:MAG: hybrid sensor histidine kinase/response regulator [Deltaproteobacteria bacterium]|nr:hybrid sensor histidine kinase/response regulator [Deltaproteobacteria bacterium]